MLVAVTVAHTVEGNWQVRIKRDFGCWGASPYRAGPCLETVIGTQNCTRKKKRNIKFWGDFSLWSWDPTPPFTTSLAQQLYSEPRPTLLLLGVIARIIWHNLCDDLGSVPGTWLRNVGCCYEAHKDRVTGEGRRGAHWRLSRTLWLRKIPIGSRCLDCEAISIINKYRK